MEIKRFSVLVNSVALVAGLAVTLPAAAAPLVPLECTATGYLTQAQTVTLVDMASGSTTPAPGLPTAVNGAGFNALDGFIYVWDYPDTDGTSGIGRIGANGGYELLGMPSGLTVENWNIGDVTEDGYLWLSASGNKVARIDVRPGSATFLEAKTFPALVRPSNAGLSPDWAEPSNQPGKLLTVAFLRATSELALLSYDTATGQTINLGVLDGSRLPTTNLSFGAIYADNAGFLYGSDNRSGTIFRIDPAKLTIESFADGPPSSVNDGAFCRRSAVPVDFGDAPDSYGTMLSDNGPRHSLLGWDGSRSTLMLGSKVTLEVDGQPVDGDSDDAFTAAPTASSQTSVTIRPMVTNNSGSPATLFAWFDANGDGAFTEDEALAPVVVAATSQVDLQLPPAANAGTTWLRLRLIPEGTTVGPLGGSTYGEVEDWPVTVTQVPTPTPTPTDSPTPTPTDSLAPTVPQTPSLTPKPTVPPQRPTLPHTGN